MNIRDKLKNIKDIEKYERKLVLRKIVPLKFSFFNNILDLMNINKMFLEYGL